MSFEDDDTALEEARNGKAFCKFYIDLIGGYRLEGRSRCV